MDTEAKVSVGPPSQTDRKCPQQILTYNQAIMVLQSVHIHSTFLQKAQDACQEFEHMIQEGVIQSSPLYVHTMPKNNPRDWHPCGDYHTLNNTTVPDRYPIPHIQDFTIILNRANIFPKLDLVRAYHQMPIKLTDVHKTTITTRVPLGLL